MLFFLPYKSLYFKRYAILPIDVFRTIATCGCCRLFVCLFFLSFLACKQARIHTGFHRFKEISHIFQNKYPNPPRSLRLGNRSIFILDPRLVRISSFWEGSRFLLIQARIRHSALFCRCDFAFVSVYSNFEPIQVRSEGVIELGITFLRRKKFLCFLYMLNVRKYNWIS